MYKLYHRFVCLGKHIGYTGFRTIQFSGIHWGSSNISPSEKGGLLYLIQALYKTSILSYVCSAKVSLWSTFERRPWNFYRDGMMRKKPWLLGSPRPPLQSTATTVLLTQLRPSQGNLVK